MLKMQASTLCSSRPCIKGAGGAGTHAGRYSALKFGRDRLHGASTANRTAPPPCGRGCSKAPGARPPQPWSVGCPASRPACLPAGGPAAAGPARPPAACAGCAARGCRCRRPPAHISLAALVRQPSATLASDLDSEAIHHPRCRAQHGHDGARDRSSTQIASCSTS